jgi:hypothetical protein
MDDEETTRRRRRWLLLFIVLLILLLLCLGGALYYIFNRDNGTPTTNGPSTSNSQVTVPTSASTSSAPPTVSPSPSVSPSVSPSPTNLTVDNVVGLTGDAAETKLKGTGFTKVTFIADDGSAPLPQWKVTKQTPAGGTSVAASTEIILTVHSIGSGKG